MGRGCSKCGGKLPINQQEYEKRLYELYPHLHLEGPYFGFKKETTFYCNRCRGRFQSKPSLRVMEGGCPVCSHQMISNPTEYINSIWASPYREYASSYMSEDNMKKYTVCSDKYIETVCPDCGRHKKMTVKHLLNDGFNCVCNDHVSFPNKFVYEFIRQLDIDFEPEYNPDWVNNKRYDLYVADYNLIIENHGMQHYRYTSGTFSAKTLQEQEENDEYKKQVALKNGVKHYVILDCRWSNMEWICSSIMNSELPNLLNFEYKDIDWVRCLMATSNNIVKQAAELWERGMTTFQIARTYKLHTATISKYLKKAAKIGWCSYTPAEAMRRKGKNSIDKIYKQSVPVYYCDEGVVFPNYSKAKTICIGYKNPHISGSCDGTYKTSGGHQWKLLYDYTKKDGTIIQGTITFGFITEEEAISQLNKYQLIGDSRS